MKSTRFVFALMLLPAVVVSTSSIRAQAIPMCLGMRATIVGTSQFDTIYGTAAERVMRSIKPLP